MKANFQITYVSIILWSNKYMIYLGPGLYF